METESGRDRDTKAKGLVGLRDKIKRAIDNREKETGLMLNEVGRRLVFKFQTMETMYQAIITGNETEVKFLLEAGLGVNTPFSDGLYPLTVAAMHGREEVAKCLVESGALVNR